MHSTCVIPCTTYCSAHEVADLIMDISSSSLENELLTLWPKSTQLVSSRVNPEVQGTVFQKPGSQLPNCPAPAPAPGAEVASSLVGRHRLTLTVGLCVKGAVSYVYLRSLGRRPEAPREYRGWHSVSKLLRSYRMFSTVPEGQAISSSPSGKSSACTAAH